MEKRELNREREGGEEEKHTGRDGRVGQEREGQTVREGRGRRGGANVAIDRHFPSSGRLLVI